MAIETIIAFVFLILLSVALGVIVGRHIWPVASGPDLSPDLTVARNELARLAQENQSLDARNRDLDHDIRAASTEAKTRGEEAARLAERSTQLSRQNDEYAAAEVVSAAQTEDLRREKEVLGAEVARLTEREIALSAKIAEQSAQLGDMQKQLTVEFENIANRILKARSDELSEGSQKTLSAILDPLKERIQEFQNKIDTTFDAEKRDVLSLKEQIKTMV